MLQRYLNELVVFGLVKVTGGGRNRNGYTYALTSESAGALRERISTSVAQMIERVRAAGEPMPARTRKRA